MSKQALIKAFKNYYKLSPEKAETLYRIQEEVIPETDQLNFEKNDTYKFLESLIQDKEKYNILVSVLWMKGHGINFERSFTHLDHFSPEVASDYPQIYRFLINPKF